MVTPKGLTIPPTAMDILTADRLNDLGDGDFTVTIDMLYGLFRDDGQPSQPGDVLSVQENGTLQTRPAGTTGAFERCKKTTVGLVFRPRGVGTRAYLIALASDAPN